MSRACSRARRVWLTWSLRKKCSLCTRPRAGWTYSTTSGAASTTGAVTNIGDPDSSERSGPNSTTSTISAGATCRTGAVLELSRVLGALDSHDLWKLNDFLDCLATVGSRLPSPRSAPEETAQPGRLAHQPSCQCTERVAQVVPGEEKCQVLVLRVLQDREHGVRTREHAPHTPSESATRMIQFRSFSTDAAGQKTILVSHFHIARVHELLRRLSCHS